MKEVQSIYLNLYHSSVSFIKLYLAIQYYLSMKNSI